jgi:anaerobic ribonucleoside-triphosphate reductase activating protein
MLKYYNYDIVFQEVPDEVSLAVNISNCPNRCHECHSKHLWQDVGVELTDAELSALLKRYSGLITCFCMMGGDADKAGVEHVAEQVHAFSNLKVAWYSGQNDFPQNMRYFQYLKLGPYVAELGGLKSPKTNQRFYKNENGIWIDKTDCFRKTNVSDL